MAVPKSPEAKNRTLQQPYQRKEFEPESELSAPGIGSKRASQQSRRWP